ncbi:glycerophosphoryl diester phosphodiesterase [Trypanosoma cruzi cruzi]|uniref:Putative glycerophosphoryl diester phosphodiesterase n=1 Tax=Trypanosoma cruzi TaxID=5693 RepID=A0A2V2UK02_TRYCR|nr:glycerophosphoryl diester phosphodiesterase [Trypanosoma cruzi cruzi]PWU84399.1 putative glycerophosphoryl diester phosphodiesterase [Trypanosoma cruzi]
MVSCGVCAILFLGGYIMGAGILVRVFPLRLAGERELLKERFPYPVTKIAHRGGSLIGPENTIYTFGRAISVGNADMLELDVRQSRDGEIVVSHDAALLRTCGSFHEEENVFDIVVDGNPNKTLPQSLREIPIHFESPQRGGCYKATDSVPVDETTRLCVLSEVFDAFPDVPLHIDIKSEGAEITKKVLKLIERYGRETKTLVGSSNWRNRKHIYDYFVSGHLSESERLLKKRKRFRIFAGPMDCFVVYVAYVLGVLPLVPLAFDLFSIPVFTKCKMKALGSCFTRFIAYFVNSPVLWKHLQRRGILVLGWVLNDDEEFEEASNWPINGIISDDPIALDAFFKSREMPTAMNIL